MEVRWGPARRASGNPYLRLHGWQASTLYPERMPPRWSSVLSQIPEGDASAGDLRSMPRKSELRMKDAGGRGFKGGDIPLSEPPHSPLPSHPNGH